MTGLMGAARHASLILLMATGGDAAAQLSMASATAIPGAEFIDVPWRRVFLEAP